MLTEKVELIREFLFDQIRKGEEVPEGFYSAIYSLEHAAELLDSIGSDHWIELLHYLKKMKGFYEQPTRESEKEL